jgi:tetratricopeptide (TPR) repeat protein
VTAKLQTRETPFPARLRVTALGRVAAGAGLLLACASTPRKPDREPLPDEQGAPGEAGLRAASDPMSAAAGPVVQVDRRKISDEERGDFDKAADAYLAARKAGKLKAECDGLANSFRKVADDNPQLLEARHNQAALLFECGKDSEAKRIWEGLAGGNRPFAPALSSLGYLAWRGGDVGEAERYFARSIAVDKQAGSIGAYLNLAQIMRNKARATGNAGEKATLNDQAIRYLRTVLAVDGNNLQAYAVLCYFYFDLGLFDAAKLVGDQAVGRAQEIATGKFLGSEEAATDDGKGGGKKGAKGKKAAAKDDDAGPKTSKEVAPEGTGYTAEMRKQLGMVWNTLGLVDLRRTRISASIASFKRAIEYDPELHEARMNLAALSLKFRDYTTAEQNFRTVLQAQPKNYEATLGLGVALRGGRKVDEAEQMYVAAQKLDGNNPDSYFNLGVLYQEYKGVGDKGALQKAQQYYRDYVGKNGPRRKEAEKRIKDIDEMFAALAEAEKLQREAEEIQRKAEEQQKKMEEEMKKMQEQEKQQGATSPAGAAAPTGAGPAAATGGGTAPPPVSGPAVPGTGAKK